jgi:hypothetical protein
MLNKLFYVQPLAGAAAHPSALTTTRTYISAVPWWLVHPRCSLVSVTAPQSEVVPYFLCSADMHLHPLQVGLCMIVPKYADGNS